MKFSFCLLITTAAAALQDVQSPLGPSSLTRSHFSTFQSHTSSDHKIRIKKQNDTICDAHTSQYTGWLDVGSKHLFFWFLESQNEPSSDPLTLWMSGGPGASSTLGLMMELGPCLINPTGNGTIHNLFGWNHNSSLLFVDQPAGTGFSYADEGEAIPGDSFTAAADMHIFLQIFTSQVFPELQKLPFHIAGESYGGHYVPTLGAQIVQQNALHPSHPQINLKSVLIGNAFVSPMDSFFGLWETVCTTKPGVTAPVFNKTRCDLIAENLPRCTNVARACYNHPDPAICFAARQVCFEGVFAYYINESYVGGRNPYDITKTCEAEDFCYVEGALLEKYLNMKSIRQALGVPHNVKNYTGFSKSVFDAFQLTNDEGITMQPQVLYLLSSEIDVMFYQGNLDLVCNTAGNLRWAGNMPWKGQAEFVSKDLEPWMATVAEREVKAGTFKEVYVSMGGKSERETRFAFVTINHAGHLVPMDQPEIALEMFNTWISRGKFT